MASYEIKCIRKNDLVSKMSEIYLNDIKDKVENRKLAIDIILNKLKESFIVIYENDLDVVKEYVENQYKILNSKLRMVETESSKNSLLEELDRIDIFTDSLKELKGDCTQWTTNKEFNDSFLRMRIKLFLMKFGFEEKTAELYATTNDGNDEIARRVFDLLKLMDNPLKQLSKDLVFEIYKGLFHIYNIGVQRGNINLLKTKGPLSVDQFADYFENELIQAFL